MVNDKSPALVVLAAGLGKRFGGYKQVEAISDQAESIMEFSIKDAINAGFRKIVLVINKDIESEVNNQIITRFKGKIDISYTFQEIENVPLKSTAWKNRIKPWGTGHAILAARGVINSAFAVINADDFYGPSAFILMKKFLEKIGEKSNQFFMLGYQLSNTLSKHGGVSRGLCKTDGDYLLSINEIKDIKSINDKVIGDRDGKLVELSADSMVSMNFWGFSPSIFDILEDRFIKFLQENGQNDTSEFYITEALDHAIRSGAAKIKVIPTNEKWFGLTHMEDKDGVSKGIREYLQASNEFKIG
ncbi:nucleotidyltransferase [bacterium]|nr:nucleotidyltransferase [bacterium]